MTRLLHHNINIVIMGSGSMLAVHPRHTLTIIRTITYTINRVNIPEKINSRNLISLTLVLNYKRLTLIMPPQHILAV